MKSAVESRIWNQKVPTNRHSPRPRVFPLDFSFGFPLPAQKIKMKTAGSESKGLEIQKENPEGLEDRRPEAELSGGWNPWGNPLHDPPPDRYS